MSQVDPDSTPVSTYPTKRPWSSLTGVVIVQGQNAFNDNFLKFVLINLAGIVAAGESMGKYAHQVLPAFIPLAFILFAPLAGFLSDRHSKRTVIFWCIVAQVLILGLTLLSVVLHNLLLAMLCLFLLSIQSTFFSPAKQGIIKELVGSKKLAMANGVMQMMTTLAILGGMGLGGWWFGARVKDGIETWEAAMIPILMVSVVALVPLLINLIVDKTPVFAHKAFSPGVLVSHFFDLKELFDSKAKTLCAVGIGYYWLVASFIGVKLFEFGKEAFPDDGGLASQESSRVTVLLGVGIIIGSVLVALISRNGTKLTLSRIGGFGLAISCVLVGMAEAGTLNFYGALIILGTFAALFLVPINAFLQDLVLPERRGKLLAASTLVTSLAGVFAIVFSLFLTQFDLTPGVQMYFFVVPTILVTWYVSRLIKIQGEMTSTTAAAN